MGRSGENLMSSKLLKPGSEMYGKKKYDADMGLKADGGASVIASVSKDDRAEMGVAPLRSGKRITADKTGKGFTTNYTAMGR